MLFAALIVLSMFAVLRPTDTAAQSREHLTDHPLLRDMVGVEKPYDELVDELKRARQRFRSEGLEAARETLTKAAALARLAGAADSSNSAFSEAVEALNRRFESAGAYSAKLSNGPKTVRAASGALGEFEDVFAEAPFLFPTAIAFDDLGRLYVGDILTNSVLRFGPDGRFDREFTSDENLFPADIDFDEQGHVYVSSFTTDEVLRWDEDGTFIGVFASDGVIASPFGLAFDDAGNLYVNSAGIGQIHRWDAAGNHLGAFITTADGVLGDIEFDGAGVLYVAKPTVNQIDRFGAAGNFLGVFASDPEVLFPTGLAFDDSGNLLVSTANELAETSIVRLDSNGNVEGAAIAFESQFASFGPIDVHPDGRIYHGLFLPDGIFHWESDGTPLGTFIPGGMLAPTAIAFDDQGRLYVAELGFKQILRWNPNGTFDDTFVGCCDIELANSMLFGANGSIYVSNAPAHEVLVYDADGELITVIGPASGLSTPTGLAFDDAGNLYVANLGGNNILKFTADGTFIDVFVAHGDAGLPQGIAFTGEGHLLVVSSLTSSVLEFDENGTILDFFATGNGLDNPMGLVIDDFGRVYVSSFSSNEVLQFNADGSFGEVAASGGLLDGPWGIALDNENRLYVSSIFSDQVLRYNVSSMPVANGISPVSALEDAIDVSVSLGASFDDVETPDASLVFTVTGNTNTSLVATSISGMNLTLDFLTDANGSATLTVRATDLDGRFVETPLVVDVTAVNDRPSFRIGADLSVVEDAGAQTIENWAMDISAGADNESSQSLEFEVSNDNPELFSAPPRIDPQGTLRYTTAVDAAGAANVIAKLFDDGGTANGGRDDSRNEAFTITVSAADDPPVISAIDDQSTDEDVPPNPITFTVTDKETAESDLVVTASTDNDALISSLQISGTGSERALTLGVAPNASGDATVTVSASDDHGTGIRTFGVAVQAVNDAPAVDTSKAFVLHDIDEDDRWNAGTTVHSLLRMGTTTAAFTDVDGDSAGIAIESVDDGSGTWQFTTDGGTTWQDMTTVSTSVARLLRANESTFVRFRPAPGFAGEVPFTFRGWDGTFGTPGRAADVGMTGGFTAFSGESAQATVRVRFVPEAPDLQLSLETVPAFSAPGTLLRYNLAYTVVGRDSARSVALLAVPPRYTSVVAAESASGWSTSDRFTYKMHVGDLAPGDSGRAHLTIQVGAPLPSFVTALHFEAMISDDGNAGTDPNPKNNSASSATALERSDALVQWAKTNPSMEAAEQLPTAFALGSNYPNPFNPSTVIPFELPDDADVTLRVFDALGRTVITLVDERLPAGRYAITWNADALPSGAYVYRLETGGHFGASRVLILTK